VGRNHEGGGGKEGGKEKGWVGLFFEDQEESSSGGRGPGFIASGEKVKVAIPRSIFPGREREYNTREEEEKVYQGCQEETKGGNNSVNYVECGGQGDVIDLGKTVGGRGGGEMEKKERPP